MSDLTKRENETMTEFTIRQIRWDILSDIQTRLTKFSEVDLSSIAEQHKVGYKAGFRQAVGKIDSMIEDAKWEDNSRLQP